jgi:hypothetical protein
MAFNTLSQQTGRLLINSPNASARWPSVRTTSPVKSRLPPSVSIRVYPWLTPQLLATSTATLNSSPELSDVSTSSIVRNHALQQMPRLHARS